MKNKILHRRKCLLIVQKTIRGYLTRKQHMPRYKGIAKIRLLEKNLVQMDTVTSQLTKERDSAKKNIENLRNSIKNACHTIKVGRSSDNKTLILTTFFSLYIYI